MAGEVVVDALPYFDQGYDETGVREAAIALVEEETRRYRPTKNYLDYLPPANYSAFETEIMKTEFERMQSRLPMDMMNMKRYELPPPPAGKMTDVAAWNECVDNSQAQLEHQALRKPNLELLQEYGSNLWKLYNDTLVKLILNLELLQEYGSNSWKSYNDTLVKLLEQAQKQLADLKKKIQEINWQRKNEQSQAGAKLKDLENSWVGLVSKNYEIERACVELEKELAELESKHRQKKSKR